MRAGPGALDLHDARPTPCARPGIRPEKSRSFVDERKHGASVAPTSAHLDVRRGQQHRWWTSGQPRTRDAPAESTQLGDRFMSTSSFTAGAAELRLPLPARRRRTGPRRCPRLPGRDIAENLVARAAGGNEPDHRADRDTHAPDARLSAHYGGVTSDARQLWHVEAPLTLIVGEPRPLTKPAIERDDHNVLHLGMTATMSCRSRHQHAAATACALSALGSFGRWFSAPSRAQRRCRLERDRPVRNRCLRRRLPQRRRGHPYDRSTHRK